jgi:hypothetical protein
MNNNLKLLALYDKISGKIRELKEELSRVEKQEGPTGPQGLQGPKGEKGDSGKDGVNGKDGRNGVDGKDGIDGADGTSITDVELDFDNHLRVTLSNGTVLDAGQIELPENLESGSTVVNYSGGFGRNVTWIEYTANWSSEPTLLYTQPDGSEIYLYTYDNGVLYRFVPSDLSVRKDGFYRKFEDNDVTSLVIERGMRI